MRHTDPVPCKTLLSRTRYSSYAAVELQFRKTLCNFNLHSNAQSYNLERTLIIVERLATILRNQKNKGTLFILAEISVGQSLVHLHRWMEKN